MSRNYIDLDTLRFSATFASLERIKERSACPKCQHMRKFYCYDCVIPLLHEPPRGNSLPIQIHIIKHAAEKSSKSSVIPLKLAYPENIFLYTFFQPNSKWTTSSGSSNENEGHLDPPLPADLDLSRCAILFPLKGRSVGVEEAGSQFAWSSSAWLAENTGNTSHSCNSVSASTEIAAPVKEESSSKSHANSITSIIVIDASWTTASQVFKVRPEFARIPSIIHLSSKNETLFWRGQSISRSFLSSCEAIYVFLREVFDFVNKNAVYDGRFDDLLYYYVWNRQVINEIHCVENPKKYRGDLPEHFFVKKNCE
jgi:hypothetical protein